MCEESERAIGYLSGSPVRSDVLERLIDDTVRPAALVEHTGASRTTVHRTLTELVERNWARRVDGGYTATSVGRRALEIYRTARARCRTLERVEPFLTHLGSAVDDLKLAWLSSADLATATETAPHYPVEWYADRLAETVDDRFRGVSPVVSRPFMAAHEPIVEDGATTELVIGESAFEVVLDRYPEEFRESAESELYELYVADETPPLGLSIVADAVFLGAYDGNGQPTVILESDDERLREWALERYRTWREDARPATSETARSR